MNDLGRLVWQVLQQTRILPSVDPSTYEPWTDFDAGDDLLATLASPRSSAEVTAAERRRSCRVRKWAQHHFSNGARLTIGPDAATFDGFRKWNGLRLVWWPRGIPTGRRVGLLSSHLGRKLNQHQDWFRVFRTACAKVDHRHEVIVTAATTTAHEVARRAAELFDLRSLSVTPPRHRQGLRNWWDELIRQDWPSGPGSNAVETSSGTFDAYVSPRLDQDSAEGPPRLPQSPLADRVLMAMSERLLVFHLRRPGRLLPLIKRRLADPFWKPQSISVALGQGLVPRKLADDLLAAGALGWVVLPDAIDESDATQVAPVVSSFKCPLPRIIRMPNATDWRYLTHCTRAAHGAWPGQEQNEFLDELILSPELADHSAFSALQRILAQQQILATSQAIRGGTNVVSFTAVPLAELPRLRAFRVHRGRWDFEPYGICIRLEHLQQLGARPVMYGEESDWEQLGEADRPFFQRQYSVNAKTAVSNDWSQEREWRVIGNVDLEHVDEDSVIVFVSSAEEAKKLQPHCHWPIVVSE